MYVLVRRGKIIKSGAEVDCIQFGIDMLPDDNWCVISYDEYNYLVDHPQEVYRDESASKQLMHRIAHNVKSGRSQEVQNRPLRYYKNRRR